LASETALSLTNRLGASKISISTNTLSRGTLAVTLGAGGGGGGGGGGAGADAGAAVRADGQGTVKSRNIRTSSMAGVDSGLRALVFSVLEPQPARNAAARNKSLNAP